MRLTRAGSLNREDLQIHDPKNSARAARAEFFSARETDTIRAVTINPPVEAKI